MAKTKEKPRPCSCHEHRVLVPTVVGDHEFKCASTHDAPWLYDAHNGDLKWRWECSCGKHGRWQQQSPSVAYHAWENHLRKEGIYA